MALRSDSAVAIADGIYWIGDDDRTASIFEGAFPIPEGVSYNSYLMVSDDQTCLLDTCDSSVFAQFWRKLRAALGDRGLDVFVINHMEPDHGAGIVQVLEAWPDVQVVGNAKTFEMLENFYGIVPANMRVVEDGEETEICGRRLRFVFAPMVHWPEVMFTLDLDGGILFSADAFGTFGTLSGALYADEADFDRDYLDEARRYYSNIVGKYGNNVQRAFKKLEGADIRMICPLHGPIWRQDIGYILGKYDLWSRYEPEEKGVVIGYTSMYGNTAAVADRLALLLKKRGIENVTMYDVTRTHPSYVVSDAFRFTNIVLAAPTYNNALHPTMSSVIEDMENMAVQRRRYSVIGNGSWVPQSPRIIEERMSKLKDMTKVGETFVIKSSMKESQLPDLEKLADDIAASMQ